MADAAEKKVYINADLCDLCGTCVGICPENVIRLSRYRLSIEHGGCTRCSKCIWVCPVSALELLPSGKIPSAVNSLKI